MSAKITTDSQERKDTPVFSGFMAYFPLAMAEVARLSKEGNDKHNPGEPLHWARGKSEDHADCIVRHQLEVGVVDTDGFLHEVKVAWRAMAQLQTSLEQAQGIYHGEALAAREKSEDGIDILWNVVEEYRPEPVLTGLLTDYKISKLEK